MNCKDLILHILGNAKAYIEEYQNIDFLDDEEVGILQGLYFDVDSIKNHLEMEKLDTSNIQEIEELEKELNLDNILNKLKELIGRKEI